MSVTTEDRLLYEGAEWDFDTLRIIHDACAEIAGKELGLDWYTNRIEVISAEQMLDAYASTGLPLSYRHWSFGKHFAQHEAMYRRGLRGLAYEIVINSDPCVSYVMEENTATMQALVIAHAAFGHNHFFKNNRLFREWTDAKGILDYLEFAKGYVQSCEEQHGEMAVERVLDSAHALMSHGVHRHRRRAPDLQSEQRRERERREHDERMYNVLWSTLPEKTTTPSTSSEEERRRTLLQLPGENILYFLEKTAPRLQPWQREILRIVRNIAQYFLPQRQTKVMNEGCATYVHHRILNRLHSQGRITDGHLLEALHSHTSVIMQPGFDDQRYSGINPYALGFAMMTDIARIAEQPTEEDREWFPDFAGSGDAMEVLRYAWSEFRDESFILQFLSPKVMRDLRLFHLVDDVEQPALRVDSMHDERGYRRLRRALARQYDPATTDADIQVVDVDLSGDRRLILEHYVQAGRLLDDQEARQVLRHLASLWTYDVVLREVAVPGGAALREHVVSPPR
ncbi:SpoVR family protein [Siccirubricoccus sp. KC 17139]|uniref:SpoVR family protein n=1 Tax=Siccirubricoccus soli TaxID=2899147 RepID=A0ABT1DAG4_9PROT|nr:SpoVR family protein [Siccirubricoccus soli]MCO6418927.1 SpoVR family protein [Siccirubricoccus soli]MCP2685062.1 SpoVR family protein [Siccirubricoccus soli]